MSAPAPLAHFGKFGGDDPVLVQPDAEFHCDRLPARLAGGNDLFRARHICEQGAPLPVLEDFGNGTAHVDVDRLIPCKVFALTGGTHDGRIAAEQLRRRLFFSLRLIQQLARRLAVIKQPLRADHFRKTKARPETVAKFSESKVGIARQRCAEYSIFRIRIAEFQSLREALASLIHGVLPAHNTPKAPPPKGPASAFRPRG